MVVMIVGRVVENVPEALDAECWKLEGWRVVTLLLQECGV